jgi:hypothetical protein
VDEVNWTASQRHNVTTSQRHNVTTSQRSSEEVVRVVDRMSLSRREGLTPDLRSWFK